MGTTIFQTYLGTMAQAAKKAGAQPIFLTSTSYIECGGSTAKTNRGFVAETKAAGTANNVPVHRSDGSVGGVLHVTGTVSEQR